MDNSHLQKKETSESYVNWLWNKDHDEERRLVIEESARAIRHERSIFPKKERSK